MFFRSIGVFSLLLLTVGLLLACGSASAPTAAPTAPTAAPTTAVSPTPLAAAASPNIAAPSAPAEQPTPVAQPNPTPAGALPSPAAELPTATPQPVTEPATATPAPLPTATTAPLPTATPTPPPPPTATPTPAERDRAILTAFYHAMDGPNWADNTNWLSDAPIHEWYGVRVKDSNYKPIVTWLYLDGNRLKGEIPAELGGLAELQNLHLGNNLLSGCIPPTLVYHRNLRSSNFGHLKPCESPDRAALVDFYHATDGPNWYGPSTDDPRDASNYNWLTDAPIGDWSGVAVNERGRVWGLELSGLGGEIPAAALSDLTELRQLSLQGLRWTTPEGMTITHQLRGEIPPELGNLVNLKRLLLSHNQLTGEIPPELGNLSNLGELRLGNNQLTGAIPPELGNLSNLGELWLANNRLTGTIPPELGNLDRLRELWLDNNQLTGAIPPELGNLANLESLLLSHNQLSGEIPPELGNLNLKSLWLDNNQLTGAIPPELIYAGRVSLSGNQFSGCVSPALQQLRGFVIEELGLEWCP